MEGDDYKLELVLFGFSLAASIGFLSVTLLGPRLDWIGYGYSLIYFIFSIVLGYSAWKRRKK